MVFRPVYLGRGLFARLAWIAALVWITGWFSWQPLCVALARVTLTLSQILGISVRAIGETTLLASGVPVAFEPACTMIQAAFALVPVLWVWDARLERNLAMGVAACAGVFVLAIIRVQLAFVGLAWGVPWWLAHDVLTGVIYFALFLVIAQRQPWLTAARPAELPCSHATAYRA